LLDRLKQLFAEAKAAPVTQEPIVPVAEVSGEAEARPERRKKKRINAVAGTRVLIVDDSPTIVALLSRMLKQNHYTVLEAGDGESALEIARKERPGLIFLDIVLPGMSGFTALRTLRHDPVTKDIPIVMISGNAQATEQFYVQRIGADNFMKKPFSRAEVFTYIERLLDEEFVPRRFNTFVHDTTLEPMEPEDTEDLADETSESATAPAVESAAETAVETPTVPATAAVESAADGVMETPAVAPAAVVEAAMETPAVAPVAAVEAAAETPAVAPSAVETPVIAPAAETATAAPVVEQTTLSFAEMVEALLESSPDEAQADSSPAPASAEPAATPVAQESAAVPAPAPDIFVDINAGWRRPAQRTPPQKNA
jgi:twitching motility two-component system response regulator PilH